MSVFIVAAKRTPFGSFNGTLANVSATHLAAHVTKACLSSAKIDPSIIDSVIFGNVAQTALDACYLPRHASLHSGIKIETPALGVNRLCGSGFQSVINGAQEIKDGASTVVVCGGTENMSQAPLAVYGNDVRGGVALGKGLALQDTLWAALTDSYAKLPMGMTAENLAKQNHITREQVDEFALRSQQAYAKAHKDGVFNAEIAPIEVKTKKGVSTFSKDEHPRAEASLESLAKLKPVFSKEGVVTAGNASGINDGAGAVILASEAACKTHNLKPLARIVSYAVAGVDPSIMGIGPVPAIKKALKNAGLTLADMDRVEINEAFAAQYLACEKQLGLDRSKANVNGGAVAIGHPLGASGSRITAHLTHELHRIKGRYAVGSACIGGGQGIAVIIERM